MTQPLKKYQRRHQNGFTWNKLLKRPKTTRAKWIYSAVDLETRMYRGDVFLPTWDETDHLHFACSKCKHVADILTVRFDAHYAKKPNPRYALFFYLGCPNCGATGQRKIYLDMREDAAKFQHTYDNRRVYYYADKRAPEGVFDMFKLAEKAKKETKK